MGCDTAAGRATRHKIDLDAYCERIGYSGCREASLETLRAVHNAHATSIPFENLDVLAGRRISVDAAEVERKLVRDRRGGYCFEHGTLLMDALSQMGFEVIPITARIRWQVPADVVTNLGHMRLLVRLGDRSYVADTGLGATTLPEPLLLEPHIEQPTSLDIRRLVPVGEELLEQVNFGSGWVDICMFRPVGVPAPDFELGNWYHSTHPQSLFVCNLVVALPGADHRRSLFNHEFVTRWVDGRTEREMIGSERRMRAVLNEHFGLNLSHHDHLSCEGLAWPR